MGAYTGAWAQYQSRPPSQKLVTLSQQLVTANISSEESHQVLLLAQPLTQLLKMPSTKCDMAIVFRFYGEAVVTCIAWSAFCHNIGRDNLSY